ncbi:MAG: hypothetical protein QXP04_00345 [Candidatus Nanoarchaeia archaeon]|nr:hypothetical protein [Candidatus Jingweiarchaeum tengchongense]
MPIFFTDKKKRKRVIPDRNRGTIFFAPKYKIAAERISLRSPEEARASAEWLLDEFSNAKTLEKKRRIKKFAVLAHNRAKVMAENERLSPKEREEALKIANIYKRAYSLMNIPHYIGDRE